MCDGEDDKVEVREENTLAELDYSSCGRRDEKMDVSRSNFNSKKSITTEESNNISHNNRYL
jgi:hypothetical protein